MEGKWVIVGAMGVVVLLALFMTWWNDFSEENCFSERCRCERRCISYGYEYDSFVKGGYSSDHCWCIDGDGRPIEVSSVD